MKIPSSVPVFIQDVEVGETKQYSKAKLKIFYIGETPDHRLFTKDFSDKVLKSLPNTPVVAFWDSQKQDFRGHHSEQFIYGIVPESATIEYEEDEESGNTFAVTDVILYTERTDNIGEVAKKIVGKQHSLEIKSDSLKYKVNRDSAGRFMNIQFTDGVFIGLSVLGDDETPAFKGSGFFDVEDFSAFADKCAANFVNFLTFLNESGGKITVFDRDEYFSKAQAATFAQTMQGFQEDIYRCLDNLGVYGYLLENTTEYAVVSTWNADENRSMLVKYTIKNEDGQMSLVNPVECVVQYVEKETAHAESSFVEEKKKKEEEDGDEGDTPDAPDAPDTDTPDSDDDDDDEEKKKKTQYTADVVEDIPAEGVANATTTTVPETTEEENGEVTESAANTCTSTLSDGERTELETYRRVEKLNKINEYKQDLAEDVIADFVNRVDEFSLEQLEAALALKFRNAAVSAREQEYGKTPVNFSYITPVAAYDANNVADVVNKYKNR